MVKALSLWQPWASLIAVGEKQIETRSWATNYRGPLVIHAARKWSADLEMLCHGHPFYGALRQIAPNGIMPPAFQQLLPFGVALCVVDLRAVHRTDLVVDSISSKELAFGDYTPGRYAWILANVRLFPEPIPWHGAQGLWNWNGPLPEGMAS